MSPAEAIADRICGCLWEASSPSGLVAVPEQERPRSYVIVARLGAGATPTPVGSR
jgi:hypothetical protein